MLSADLKAYMLHEVCDSSDNRFALLNLREYITSCDTHVAIEHPSKRITVHYIYPQHDMRRHKIPSGSSIRILLNRVSTLCEYFGVEIPNLTVYILPSLLPRVFPVKKKKEVFEPRHINGGYTYLNKGSIIIYRCEELAKVFLHEVCHHMPIHITHFDESAVQRVATFFNIKSALLVNEAVVEFWARVMQCKMLADKYHIPMRKMLQKEIEYSISQTKRVLQYKDKVLGSKWIEHTNAFSYIVLTSVLLTFHKEFMRIPYPYVSSDAIATFILEKFASPAYQRRIRRATVPTSTSCRMTVFGDII